MNKVYLNGKIMAKNKATLSIYDRGFNYGDAIFETLRTFNGEPFLLKEHLKRLKFAGRQTKIKIPSGLVAAVIQLIKSNRTKKSNEDLSVRITISRGEDQSGYGLKTNLKPTVLITCNKLDLKSINNNLKKGIKVLTETGSSLSVAGIKSTNLLNMILSKYSSKSKGYDDLLWVNESGYISESLTGNVFLVKKGIIYTPPLGSGILPGVTREHLIGKLTKNGLKVQEKQIKLSKILTYDEIFITNSIQGITPVTKVNEGRFPIGELTKTSQKIYSAS